MRIRRRTPPVDYHLCNQTVTLYHWDGKDEFTRRVIEKGAFLDFKKVQSMNKTGSMEKNSFLLVIPCSEEVPVAVGDKVFHGEGPEIWCLEEWRKFKPATVPGLVVVEYVDPKYWNDQLVHVEAGG